MTKGVEVDDIDDLLGIDEDDARDALAGELVRADFTWIDQLVNRRKQLGLSQAEVAGRMGRTQSAVSDIETMSSDPRLSSLRRYAAAIDAAVKHMVFPHAQPHPLMTLEHAGVTARSVQAGPGKRSPTGGVYFSVNGGHLTNGVE